MAYWRGFTTGWFGKAEPDPSRLSWSGAHNRPGAPDEGAEADVPEGEREATRAELREAAEKSPEQPGGERGDLGDSGPGED